MYVSKVNLLTFFLHFAKKYFLSEKVLETVVFFFHKYFITMKLLLFSYDLLRFFFDCIKSEPLLPRANFKLKSKSN